MMEKRPAAKHPGQQNLQRKQGNLRSCRSVLRSLPKGALEIRTTRRRAFREASEQEARERCEEQTQRNLKKGGNCKLGVAQHLQMKPRSSGLWKDRVCFCCWLQHVSSCRDFWSAQGKWILYVYRPLISAVYNSCRIQSLVSIMTIARPALMMTVAYVLRTSALPNASPTGYSPCE